MPGEIVTLLRGEGRPMPFCTFLRRLARAEWYQRFGITAEMAGVLTSVERGWES